MTVPVGSSTTGGPGGSALAGLAARTTATVVISLTFQLPSVRTSVAVVSCRSRPTESFLPERSTSPVAELSRQSKTVALSPTIDTDFTWGTGLP